MENMTRKVKVSYKEFRRIRDSLKIRKGMQL
jgi:hypothetical protein